MRDIDLHVGQLGEHAMIELVTSEQVDATGLLTHMIGDRRKRDLALEIHAVVDQRLDRADQGAQASLHIHDAVTVKPAVLDGAIERIPLPSFAYRLGVEMSREQEVRTAFAAVHLPQGVVAPLIGLLAPDFADSERLQPGLELPRKRVFLAVGAVDTHHFLCDADRRVSRKRRAYFLQHPTRHRSLRYVTVRGKSVRHTAINTGKRTSFRP